jgi:hypothetical protein
MSVSAGPFAKVALALLVLPATCFGLCALRAGPVHGWMMRHDCPIAMFTKSAPAHPMQMGDQAP